MPIVRAKQIGSFFKKRLLKPLRAVWATLLIILALAQTSYLLVRVAPLRFALSKDKLHALHEYLNELGITYQASGTYFDLSGAIILEKPSLTSIKIGGPSLACKLLEIRLNLLNLIQGKIVATEIFCSEGQINLPLQNHKSAEGSLCAQKVYFWATNQGADWKINHFNAKIFNLSILAAGPIPQDIGKHIQSSPIKSPDSENSKRPISIEHRLENLLAQIEKVQIFLQHCENPSATVLSQYDHHGALMLSIRAFAEQVNTHEIQFTNAVAQARFKNTAEGSFLEETPTLMAESFSIHSNIQGQYFYAQSAVELVSFSNLAQDPVDWCAHKLKTPRGVIPYAFGHIQAIEPTLITGRFCAVNAGMWLNIFGSVNPQSESGQLGFEGQLTPDTLKQWSPEFPWEVLPHLEFSNAPLLQGSALFENNWQLTACSFQGICENGYVLNNPIQYATARGSFEKNKLTVKYFCLQSPEGWKTTGSYEHNLAKNEGRFSVHGSIDPNFLTPWLPAWWGPVWSDFAFQGPNWPKANLDIWVPWDHLEGFLLFGRAECSRFELRKVQVPQANLMLYCTYNVVSLNPISIQTRKSTGTGGLFLRLDDEHSDPI
ncbi:MAG TPA: hypothetical protein PLV25_04620, partial [Opitutales bacterium]|nr:hypothetical protein [Opitutales bacterium]